MKKKALSLFLVTAMAVSMVGCGSKDADKNTEKKDTEVAAATEKEAAAEDEAWEGDLTVWSPQEDQDTNWLQDQCEAFAAEHPNWKINFNYGVCPEGEAKDNVTKDVEAAADVYMLANDNIPDLVSAGALSELGGDYLGYVTSTNSDSILTSVTYNDSVVAFPFTPNTWFMYYDKSKFTDSDVKSLDKMLEKNKVAFNITEGWYMSSFFLANGCKYFGKDGKDNSAGVDISGDKGTQATQAMVSLVNNPNFVNDLQGVGIAGLRDGSVGAYFSGSWDYKSVKEILGDNFGAVSLPTVKIGGKDKQMLAFAGSKAIAVNPNCKYQQVAVALAKYLGSKDAQKKHYELRGVIPCNTELLATDEVKKDALVTAQNDTFNKTSVIQPTVTGMNDYWAPAQNFAKAIVNGEITADNAAAKTQDFYKQINTSIAK